ncbi:myosin heavy chain, partial [Cystoisospora suis]
MSLPRLPTSNVEVSFVSAPIQPLDPSQIKNEKLRSQLHAIERELKDWWISRKLLRERNLGLYNLFQRHNFTGLSINQPNLPDVERVMWNDLVQGKPDLEDSLSLDAREMKVDLYTKVFKQAADLENPCRIPGVMYLRCLGDTLGESQSARTSTCLNAFSSFDACRKGLLQQQATAMK